MQAVCVVVKEGEPEMVLFSPLKRPQSFHLKQDTDLPVNREETGRVCFHFSEIKEMHFFHLSVRNKRLARKKLNDKKRVV